MVSGVFWAVAPCAAPAGGRRAGRMSGVPGALGASGPEGITLEGELQGNHCHEGGKQYYYSYVDRDGVRRECKSSAGGAEWAEITYDPVKPDTAPGWLVAGAVLILLTGSVLPPGVAFAVARRPSDLLPGARSVPSGLSAVGSGGTGFVPLHACGRAPHFTGPLPRTCRRAPPTSGRWSMR